MARPYAKNLASSLGEGLTGIAFNRKSITHQSMVHLVIGTFLIQQMLSAVKMNFFLINIGSCWRHVVHSAFKTGFQPVDWDL